MRTSTVQPWRSRGVFRKGPSWAACSPRIWGSESLKRVQEGRKEKRGDRGIVSGGERGVVSGGENKGVRREERGKVHEGGRDDWEGE